MKRFAVIVALLLAGCATSGPGSAKNRDREFREFANEFIFGYLNFNPATAVQLGFHQYDGKSRIPTIENIQTEIRWLRQMDARLAQLNSLKLSPEARLEYRLLKTGINNQLFGPIETEGYKKNPMGYAGAIGVDIYVKRDFAPLEKRVRSIITIEDKAPQIFEAARRNLEASLAKPYVETAIEVAKGSADFLGKDLRTALKDLKDATLLADFNRANDRAIAELKSFGEYLEKEKLPKAHENYAIGREKYIKMLRGAELIDLTPEAVLEIGLKRLKYEQDQFNATAKLIDPSKPAIEVFKAIQKDHPTAESLIPDTKKNLEAIRQFLTDHKVISMPSNVRARVEETPQFARATSFASMDTPGPFETKATEAFYYVTPVEPEWGEKQKDEWLTAFNYYTTDVVSIHEAYPGHYTQFLHLNASGASKLQKILNSYAFVEGWAHYSELMLLDEGFGATSAQNGAQPDELRAAKYRLAQLDESLLRLCRLCVSIKMHCQGMTVEQATKFFVENCYYEEKPAHSEAVRGSFDPGYLFYTVGKLEFLKLRADYQKQEGAKFSLQKFHDELLSHGAPPIRLLRELMLKDRKQWDQIL